jgi:hypothetical protein
MLVEKLVSPDQLCARISVDVFASYLLVEDRSSAMAVVAFFAPPSCPTMRRSDVHVPSHARTNVASSEERSWVLE